ncbi:hypothetical protein UYSO10_3934 [Kosakonia radicincitans]|nr:hypothetical protein UYSO10_3934 [Kosakonia radicincitans]
MSTKHPFQPRLAKSIPHEYKDIIEDNLITNKKLKKYTILTHI